MAIMNFSSSTILTLSSIAKALTKNWKKKGVLSATSLTMILIIIIIIRVTIYAEIKFSCIGRKYMPYSPKKCCKTFLANKKKDPEVLRFLKEKLWRQCGLRIYYLKKGLSQAVTPSNNPNADKAELPLSAARWR